MTKYKLDLNQGTTEVAGEERTFGYVFGDGGGFFFAWMDSLDATLRSVEEDEVDGDGGLARGEVTEYLREYLPTTQRGRRMWGTDE